MGVRAHVWASSEHRATQRKLRQPLFISLGMAQVTARERLSFPLLRLLGQAKVRNSEGARTESAVC